MFREFGQQHGKDCIGHLRRFLTSKHMDKVLALARKRKKAERCVSQIEAIQQWMSHVSNLAVHFLDDQTQY